MRPATRTIRTLAAALLLSTTTADATTQQPLDLSLPELGGPADQAMSGGEGQRLGAEMLRELRARVSLSEDPAVIGYVRDLGTRLAGHVGGGRDYEFFVVENERINAFAMPGGYIGIHTGLITAARRESELAGVIAHEIAHVTQRHLARRLLANRGITMRTAALVFAGLLIGTQNPQAGAAATIGGVAGSIQSRLAHSRAHEREADRIGLKLLADADFAPQAMPDFFERLLEKNRYRREPLPFLSTHPLTTERIADSRERATALTPEKVFESPEFPLVRARVQVHAARNATAAVSRFRKQVEARPQEPGVRYGLAMALLRAKQPEQADTQLRTLVDEHGDHAVFYLGRAEAALAEAAPQQALALLNEGLSIFPGNYALQYRRVDALRAMGAETRALRSSAEALADYPADTALLRQRARTADAFDRRAEAQLALAQRFAQLGDLREALARVKRVLESGDVDAVQQSRAHALQRQWQATLERRDADG